MIISGSFFGSDDSVEIKQNNKLLSFTLTLKNVFKSYLWFDELTMQNVRGGLFKTTMLHIPKLLESNIQKILH